jgi:hypothetical protein
MLGVNVKTPQTNFSKPPPGYVAGVGRGAVGFMTRSDIGPAGANQELGGAGRGAAGRGAGAVKKPAAPGAPAGATAAGGAPTPDASNDNTFDAFAGYQERLFSDAPYEEDDAEADRIYAQVDDEMEERTTKSRQKSNAELSLQSSLSTSRIADQFADLKRQLGTISADEWEAIPEIGDRTIKKKKQESFTPVPDSILQMNRPDTKLVSGTASVGASAGGAGGSETALTGLSEARGQMLSLKLDRMSDSVSGQTVVDPKGYLTSLSSQTSISSESDIADVKKARLLLKSVITTNPKHGPGWIAASRLEEQVCSRSSSPPLLLLLRLASVRDPRPSLLLPTPLVLRPTPFPPCPLTPWSYDPRPSLLLPTPRCATWRSLANSSAMAVSTVPMTRTSGSRQRVSRRRRRLGSFLPMPCATYPTPYACGWQRLSWKRPRMPRLARRCCGRR